MYTRQMFVTSIRQEGKVITHLYSKLTPEMMDFRPTPAQRSTRELLEYIPVCCHLIAKCMQEGGFASYKEGAAAIKSAVQQDFKAALNHEIEKLAEWVLAMPESEITKKVKAPNGLELQLGESLVELNLKFLSAYRMQLFLYLKACGRTEISTVNLWAGRDPEPKK